MYHPKVTIITVVYNAVDTIERTIKSVIGQDYDEIEYIIVDGKSTDGTSEVVEKYRNYLAEYICEPDDGIYDAMNKGIRCSTGDIISIINADDWLYEHKSVSRIVEKYNEIGEISDIVSGQIAFIRNSEQSGHTQNSNIDLIWNKMPVAHPATFVKKSVYNRIGGFDTTYRIAADYDFIFRCYISKINITYLSDIIVNFSVGGVSEMARRLLFEEDSKILNKYKEFNNNPYDVDNVIREKEKLLSFYESTKGELNKALPVKIYIWGCGYWGRKIDSVLAEKGIEIEGFIDNNVSSWNICVQGKVVHAPIDIKASAKSILIAVRGKELEIARQIEAINSAIQVIYMEDLFDKIYNIKRRYGFDRNGIN